MGNFQFTDNFDKFERNLLAGVALAVDESAAAIVRAAKANVPVDHGALKASVHFVNEDEQKSAEAYQDAKDAAIAANPKVEEQVLPRFKVDTLETGVVQAVVDAPLAYAHLVENGTGKSQAQPFLGPAGEDERKAFQTRLKDELKRAAE